MERTAVNAAAGRVDPRWALAAAAASPPTLPPMVNLPPYPVRQAAAPSRLASSGPSVRVANSTSDGLTGRLQPPHREFQTFGGPANSACPPQEELLVDLSPPPGHGTIPQARDQGVRPEASRVQNVARRSYASDDHLSVQIPWEFDAMYPSLVSLHPAEAYQRSKVRIVSEESPMPASRPGPAHVIPSVSDLSPLPPSAGLRGFTLRHEELRVVENEARRITSLHSKIMQANTNVDRLRCYMQFIDGRILAAQRQHWDCAPPQPCDVDQEAFMNLPFGGEDNVESSPIIATTRGSTLQCSPMEDEEQN